MRIETDRLVIRSFEISDIDAYAAIVADPRVTRYLSSSAPHSFKEASDYVLAVVEEEANSGIVRYAVELKENGRLIGFCGFKQIGDAVDLGWRYGHEFWGRGYGSEAALAVMRYGIEILKLNNIFSVAMVKNVASVKIIEKLGYKEHEVFQKDGIDVIRFYNPQT